MNGDESISYKDIISGPTFRSVALLNRRTEFDIESK